MRYYLLDKNGKSKRISVEEYVEKIMFFSFKVVKETEKCTYIQHYF